MFRRSFLAAILACVLPWSIAAPAEELQRQGLVVEVTDGDTVVLDGGRVVRLVGLQAPKLSLGRARVPDQPLSPEAKVALENLVLGRGVELWFGGERVDRYGRYLAHLSRDDGLWVQGEMLRQGFARVYTFSDNRARASEMLAREHEARQDRRGIWRNEFYRIRDHAEAHRYVGRYELIEGRVVDVSIANRRTYVNFGQDWRQDFTATISPRDLASFRAGAIDPKSWVGKTLRVRGWIRAMNGPMIDVTHPEQIEVVSQ
ncbi:MAG: thermonuclease family protein [Alphaproteobacteria bacterium]|nr:thermonuclease family protein [Alphaproteobacteria bacterium]